MRVAVVMNVGAGAGATGRTPADVRAIEQAFRDVGVESEVHLVEGPRLGETAREAAAAGADVVVAAGGDGTINAVANALAGTDTPLGVLPLGTLNHFARDTGVPLDLAGAVRAIAQGHARPVDLGEVNGRVFVNNSSLGLYPQLVDERDAQRRRHGRSKWYATVRAALAVFRRFPLVRVRLAVEGQRMPVRTPCVFVGNNVYQMHLPAPGTRTALDRGCLSLYVAQCTRRLGLLRLAARTLFKGLQATNDCVSRCVSELWVESRKPTLRVSVDGEVVRMRAPLHYRIRPGALRVILPDPEPV